MKKLVTLLMGSGLNLLTYLAPWHAARQGFNLFCRPSRSKLTAKHISFFATAEQASFTLGKETIRTYTWGTGTTKILLLHGWQSHTYRWKNYIDAIDKNLYTIYSLDAPGHGRSTGHFMSVPYYSEAVVDYLKIIGRVDTVVGHSIGAFTALYTFHLNPLLTPNSLIMLAPPDKASAFFDFYAQQLKLSKKCVSLVSKYFEEVTKHPIEFYSAEKFANSIKSKGLIIHDEEDVETSVENSKKIHLAWRNSTLVITKGKGHNLKSIEVLDVVINFLDGGVILSRA
jgi:pimeloyl-ACP methyl ester carboxylesterase